MTIRNRFPLAVSYDSNNDPSGLAEFEPKTTDLSDIGDNTPSTGQVLTYTDDGKYQPQTPTGGGGGAVNSVNDLTGDVSLYLSSLSGVEFTQLGGAAGNLPQHIQWNGTNWINAYEDEQYILIKNNTGSTLTKGQIVHIYDFQGDQALVGLAKADSSTTMPSIGIVYSNILDTESGLAVTFGTAGVDNSLTIEGSPAVGDTLYVSPNTSGNLTVIKPTDNSHLVQNVGILLKAGSEAGSGSKVKVTGVGRANDIPNTIALGPAGETTITSATAKFTGTTANEIVITNTSNQIDSIASGTLFSQSTQVTGTVAAHSDVESGELGFGDRTLLIYDADNSTWKALSLFQVLDIAQGGTFPGGIELPGDVTNLIDHGSNLSGLGDDDHTQYVLSGGSRAMSALTVTNDITAATVSSTSSTILDGLFTRLPGSQRPDNFYWYEDYLTTNTAIARWAYAANGGSLGHQVPLLQTTDSIGILELRTNNANNRVHLTTFNQTLNCSSIGASLSYRVTANALYDAATNQGDMLLGIFNNTNTATEPTNGIFFRYSDGSTNWQAESVAGGTTTQTDTGVAVTVGTFNVLQLVVDQDWTEVKYYVDGVLKATHTLGTDNIPTGNTPMGIAINSINGATASGQELHIDWHLFKFFTTADRGQSLVVDT